jgi:hypothetical protein
MHQIHLWKKIGSVAYKLHIPEGSKVHPTFHVSQLKAFTPDYTPVHTVLPHIPQLDISDVAPESIPDRRLVKKGNKAITQILIKWTRLPDESSTWEDYHVLHWRFPPAAAWDRLPLKKGAVSPPILRRRQRPDVRGSFEAEQSGARHVSGAAQVTCYKKRTQAINAS